MAEESQEFPLAPGRQIRSDEQIAMSKAVEKERHGKCFVYVFAATVIHVIMILAFALVVFRVKYPLVKLRSVAVTNLTYFTSPSPRFNMTLLAQMTITNTNFGRFNYENGSVSMMYRGRSIGSTRLGRGRVKGRDTETFNVTMVLRSNRLLDASNVRSDIKTGVFNLTSHAKLSGTLHLLKVIKKRKVPEMYCTMSLYLKKKAIQRLRCK